VNEQNASMTETLALLGRLKAEMPDIWAQTAVVGRWLWLEFNVPPAHEIRAKLKRHGFHWNSARKCWQNPCGALSDQSRPDPRSKYRVIPAAEMELNERTAAPPPPKEYKVISLRECPLPEDMHLCDTPEKAAEYWRLHLATIP